MTTPTLDGEGIDPQVCNDLSPGILRRQIDESVAKFIGRITQRVPAFSAVKIDGQRLYEKARAGEPIKRPERQIEIRRINVVDYSEPMLTIEVACSSGTYIRSLAEDIGDALGCGAFVNRLTRTAAGSLSLNDALTIEQVINLHVEGRLSESLLRYDQVLDYSSVVIRDDYRDRILSGQELTGEYIYKIAEPFCPGDTITLKDTSGAALAVGRANFGTDLLPGGDDARMFTYLRVLN